MLACNEEIWATIEVPDNILMAYGLRVRHGYSFKEMTQGEKYIKSKYASNKMKFTHSYRLKAYNLSPEHPTDHNNL